MEKELSAKRVFSKVGIIYTVFSVLTTVLQVVSAAIQVSFSSEVSIESQIVLNSVIMYVFGMIILFFGFRVFHIPKAEISKHKMSVGDLFKAFCMCYTLLIASNMVGLLITNLIGQLKGSAVINPVEMLVSEISIPVLFFVTVICAPIFEELFFRKCLIDYIVPYGEVPAVLLSGFLFGMFHGNLSQFPYAFTLGAFFAMLYIRTGRIIYPMVLHAFINFFGSVAVTLVLDGLELDGIMRVLDSVSPTEILTYVTPEAMRSFLMLAAYEILIAIIVIIGIIFWILDHKRIVFYTREKEMERGSRLKMVLGNVPMILYILVLLPMIIYNLFL